MRQTYRVARFEFRRCPQP